MNHTLRLTQPAEAITPLVVAESQGGGFTNCGICGTFFTITAPNYALMRRDNLEPVCEDCGRYHSPLLSDMVEMFVRYGVDDAAAEMSLPF